VVDGRNIRKVWNNKIEFVNLESQHEGPDTADTGRTGEGSGPGLVSTEQSNPGTTLTPFAATRCAVDVWSLAFSMRHTRKRAWTSSECEWGLPTASRPFCVSSFSRISAGPHREGLITSTLCRSVRHLRTPYTAQPEGVVCVRQAP
jgi:hypothetical protein